MASRFPASVWMPFLPDMRCTWEPWHRPPAACRLGPAGRSAQYAIAVGLSLTRVVVLAHWASDVVAGFALGAVLERVLRLWTGYPGDTSMENDHANP
jgi:membrane-associated phospholipid phosphatase